MFTQFTVCVYIVLCCWSVAHIRNLCLFPRKPFSLMINYFARNRHCIYFMHHSPHSTHSKPGQIGPDQSIRWCSDRKFTPNALYRCRCRCPFFVTIKPYSVVFTRICSYGIVATRVKTTYNLQHNGAYKRTWEHNNPTLNETIHFSQCNQSNQSENPPPYSNGTAAQKKKKNHEIYAVRLHNNKHYCNMAWFVYCESLIRSSS